MQNNRMGRSKGRWRWGLLPGLALLLGLLLPPVSSVGQGVTGALLDDDLVLADGVGVLPSARVADTRTGLGPDRLAAGTRPGGRLLVAAAQAEEVGRAPTEALDQQTFYATADTYVLEGYPGVNLGDAVDMWAGYDNYLDPDGQIVRSLVKFDISALPSNGTIARATLRLDLVLAYDYPNALRTITTYRATDAWAEMQVTWSTQPGVGEAYGSAAILSEDWGWHEFDVTDLVAAWQLGTQANHGIVIRGPEEAGLQSGWRAFGTREGEDPLTESRPPELVVEYTATSNKLFLPLATRDQ